MRALEGKVALVIGGTRGIGAAIMRRHGEDATPDGTARTWKDL